jgi:GMP synthase (glutamine-hydrolysing)
VSETFLALQHIACEPPAAFEDELRSRGLGLERAELDEGDVLPDWREFAGLIVMGGPMGAYEDDRHPWLAAEKGFLREAVDRDVPVWGVCLGAQLLAASLGARVYRGEQAEVGLLPVELTPPAARDPVFGGVPSPFRRSSGTPTPSICRRAPRSSPSRPPTAARRFGSVAPTGSSSTWR